MLGIKRVYTFMLQRFLPLLVMTFFICLFILLMQFVWRYIDDLVGKGLSVSVISELLWYAALTSVPTALPLAILLASLMTFGNLGEKFELTALKASGISLFKIMRPLIIFMAFIAVGAFFFQNNVVPYAQTKMWTLLFSMRQKSPEVEIPEKAFYDQLPNINLFVERKNRESGMLHDLIIYDTSRGFNNARIILADSGKLDFTEDKTRLFLQLYQGEQFENLNDRALGGSATQNMPFRRESFTQKSIYIPFDANFNRMDDSLMRQQYIGQNVVQLSRSIDSLRHRVDSVGLQFGKEIKERDYMNIPYYTYSRPKGGEQPVKEEQKDVLLPQPMDIDSIFNAPSLGMARTYVTNAINKAQQQQRDFEFRGAILLDQAKLLRRHQIELIKKYTLSFACLIFFFIGAPLGAIIKKGGIGTPLVVSVILFIIYYIIDNTGYKMSRDGHINVWLGMWLSSLILLPLGIYLTYKAVGDTAVFNFEWFERFFYRLIGKRQERAFYKKDVIMDPSDLRVAVQMVENLSSQATELYQKYERLSKLQKLRERLLPDHPTKEALQKITDQLVRTEDYIWNIDNAKIVSLLNKYTPTPTRLGDLKTIIENSQTLIQYLKKQWTL